jgi:hypothetical protein
MLTEAPSDQQAGLTSEEARARLASRGPNRRVGRERAAWLKDLVSLFLDPMAHRRPSDVDVVRHSAAAGSAAALSGTAPSPARRF